MLGSLSCLMQRLEFDPPLGRNLSGRGFDMGSDSYPPNSFRLKYKLRCSLCTQAFHCTDSKDHDIHILDCETGECWQQKHTQHVPSMKTKCNYLSGWIRKRSKLSPKMMNPRDLAVEHKRRRSICSKTKEE